MKGSMKMSKFNELMKSKATGVFPGRSKRDIAEIVDKTIHINGIAEGVGARGKFMAFTVTEYPDSFFYAGGVISDALASCADAVGGVVEADKELTETPLGAVVRTRTSTSGNRYRYLEVLE